jgi:DNA-binding NarL/FixJ family response regulator
MKPIRILIADDHAIFRTALKALLALESDLQVVAEASNGYQALELISSHHPDVVLMDLAMRGLGGLDTTERVKSISPGTRVVVVSMHSAEEYVLRALRAGAVGYVPKECGLAELTAAVRTVVNGGVYLSPSVLTERVLAWVDTPDQVSLPLDSLNPRRRELLRLLAQGHTVKEAAQKLGISPKTVDALRARLMKQLGLRSVPELLRFAIRSGLVEPEP